MDNKQEQEQQEFMSINEMLALQRAKYPNRPKWLFQLHMAFLMSWLVIKHGNLKSILTFPLILLYKAYSQYKVTFSCVAAFMIYWIAMNLKAGALASCVVLIILSGYKSFKQFSKDLR